MRALRAAWIAEHGPGQRRSVSRRPRPLRRRWPTTSASPATTRRSGCTSTTTDGPVFDQGQLVIIDEATLAGTAHPRPDHRHRRQARAPRSCSSATAAQLQSVDAGGAFALLVHRRTDAPELTDDPSLHPRVGEATPPSTFGTGDVEVISHLRRATSGSDEGTTDEMLDAAYDAWRADCRAGRASILVTESSQAVTSTERARPRRTHRSLGTPTTVGRSSWPTATAPRSGDSIITRRNDRRLRTRAGGWVNNGDRWQVIDIRRDGSSGRHDASIAAWGQARSCQRSTSPTYVDLGYAVTAHRAQGITVDTSHVVVTARRPGRTSTCR